MELSAHLKNWNVCIYGHNMNMTCNLTLFCMISEILSQASKDLTAPLNLIVFLSSRQTQEGKKSCIWKSNQNFWLRAKAKNSCLICWLHNHECTWQITESFIFSLLDKDMFALLPNASLFLPFMRHNDFIWLNHSLAIDS